MEEARIKGKTARSVLSLEQRVRSYEDVLQLRRLGLSYNQIIGRINRTSGIRLARSTVEYWARGIQRPLGNVNTFDVTPRPALAYVIGGKGRRRLALQVRLRLSVRTHCQRLRVCSRDWTTASETAGAREAVRAL